MKQYNKPLPKSKLPRISEEFWKAAKRHVLLIQQCKDCGKKIFYPKPFCTKCLSPNLKWIESSGKGKVYSYAVPRAQTPQPFSNDTPYIIAVINLEEGVSMSSNIVNCKPEDMKCGMNVRVVFEDVVEGITLPRFEPV